MQELQHTRNDRGTDNNKNPDENHSNYRTLPQYTTNVELARNYFLVNIQFGGNLRSYREHQTHIACVPLDIAAFYAEHGNLEGLDAPRIGDVIKSKLELILKYGVDEAKRMLGEERDAGIRKVIQRY